MESSRPVWPQKENASTVKKSLTTSPPLARPLRKLVTINLSRGGIFSHSCVHVFKGPVT